MHPHHCHHLGFINSRKFRQHILSFNEKEEVHTSVMFLLRALYNLTKYITRMGVCIKAIALIQRAELKGVQGMSGLSVRQGLVGGRREFESC